MSIQRGSGVAVWRQIAEELQANIAGGSLSQGDRLPTEMELARQYRVNRHTVRRAIAELANDGYVEAERGRGTFVAHRPISYPLTKRTRFSEIISAQDLQPGGRVISSSIEAAGGIVSKKLGVRAGERLIRIETLRVAQGRPITVSTNWLVERMTPQFIPDYAETGSVSKALERAGYADYNRKSSWVSAEAAGVSEAAHLRIEIGAPVLVVESLNVTNDGVPLQFSRAIFLAEAVQLVVES